MNCKKCGVKAHSELCFRCKPRKPIPKESSKRKIESKVYSKNRKEFLSRPENRYCFIDGCGAIATTIEHSAGRIGSLYLDETYWRPCCLEHNSELETNSELSKQYQFSKITGKRKC